MKTRSPSSRDRTAIAAVDRLRQEIVETIAELTAAGAEIARLTNTMRRLAHQLRVLRDVEHVAHAADRQFFAEVGEVKP